MDHQEQKTAPPESDSNGGRPSHALTYCIVPRELAGRLHDPLRAHYRDCPDVEVIVERRRIERRTIGDRRAADSVPESERRRIRNSAGRRIAERRAALVPLPADSHPELPRRARRHADQLLFVERLVHSAEKTEDADTARLVTRIQAGDSQLFSEIYMRYFDRVYAYLRTVVRDSHEAEDLTQQVFTKVLEALPRYERRGSPFRGWLFVVVRNQALQHLRKHNRISLAADEEHAGDLENGVADEPALSVLDWISDHDLSIFVERLPLPQRQVLLLRFMLDLSIAEIAQVIGRSPNEVSVLQYRALGFLRKRMAAVGRAPRLRRGAEPMRRWPKPARILRRRRFALME